MSDLGQVIHLRVRLYRQQAAVGLRRLPQTRPMALLELRPGRVNPYPVYARLRADGPLTPTRRGNWVSTSHRVCDAVLRDRRFGVYRDDGTDMSFSAWTRRTIPGSGGSRSRRSARRRWPAISPDRVHRR